MVREGYNSISLDDDSILGLREIQESEGFKTIPETIRWLISNNNTKILFKIELLMPLVNSEKNPFNYLMLEIDATESQMRKVYDLMDKIQTDIQSKREVSHVDFEKEIYKIFPKHYGDYHLAESIVGILGKSGRLEEGYRHMVKNGINEKNM